MADFLREKTIKYVNKDFQSFKRDLIRFTQAHHSGVFGDFNESSPGMALLEMVSYVGDVLSFYQDMQFLELKQSTARQLENVVEFAKQRGYRPSGKRAARGVQTFFVEVPAASVNGEWVPDPSYTPVLSAGTKLGGPNGSKFETVEDVHFSASAPTLGTDARLRVTGSQFDSTTGQPTFFALSKVAPIIAGETKTESFVLGDFQSFRTIELSNPDVIEVISVVDSDGESWYEVDYLAQETVFDSVENGGSDGDVVPYVLKLRTVPKRFVTDRDPTTKKTSLVFGSGEGVGFDDELIPNLADLALELPGRPTFTSYSIDPQNFLKTRSLGLSPYSTTLTVTYRVGGGNNTNVAAGSITNVAEASLSFPTTNLDPTRKGNVEGSLETHNEVKTDGGAEEETISEIKANAGAFFAAQSRVVTSEDYIARVLSLPAKFGRVEKAFVKKNVLNPMALDVHVLTKDVDGHLQRATETLKKNISTYLGRYRMLTDGVNIMDSDIVNIRVDFGVVVSPKMSRNEVLSKCLSVVKSYFSVDSFQIAEPIVISDLAAEIQRVQGIVSVYKLQFKGMFGDEEGNVYSNVRFDPDAWTFNNILYCPDNSIFEVKYPNRDIVGEAK